MSTTDLVSLVCCDLGSIVRGRSLAATLYFVAGLAIVYGILAMVAVPLRLAVVGTCPPAPAIGNTLPICINGTAHHLRIGRRHEGLAGLWVMVEARMSSF